MINNRQNGRRRGRGGGQRQGGGGQGQRDSGNRIDSRARGNAAQLLEKYKNMARDAQMSGDRVNTEYYLQFADNYFRVLADQRGRTDDQPQRRTRDDFDQFDDIDDFGDEGEPIRGEEQARASEADAPQRERGDRGDRGRDRQRDGNREFAGREGGREDRPDRQDRRPAREDRQDRRNGHAAPVEGGRNGHAGAEDDRAPLTAATAEAAPADEGAAPRRRTRKPREAAAPVEAAGFDADRLPPSLGISAAAEPAPAADAGDVAEEAPKPRRRRVRTAAAEAAAE